MNLINEAMEAARKCRDFHKKLTLVRYTDQLRDVFGRFAISCSREDMKELVAAWTHVILAIDNIMPGDEPKILPTNNEKLTDAS